MSSRSGARRRGVEVAALRRASARRRDPRSAAPRACSGRPARSTPSTGWAHSLSPGAGLTNATQRASRRSDSSAAPKCPAGQASTWICSGSVTPRWAIAAWNSGCRRSTSSASISSDDDGHRLHVGAHAASRPRRRRRATRAPRSSRARPRSRSTTSASADGGGAARLPGQHRVLVRLGQGDRDEPAASPRRRELGGARRSRRTSRHFRGGQGIESDGRLAELLCSVHPLRSMRAMSRLQARSSIGIVARLPSPWRRPPAAAAPASSSSSSGGGGSSESIQGQTITVLVPYEMPQKLLDQFTAETGVKVNYVGHRLGRDPQQAAGRQRGEDLHRRRRRVRLVVHRPVRRRAVGGAAGGPGRPEDAGRPEGDRRSVHLGRQDLRRLLLERLPRLDVQQEDVRQGRDRPSSRPPSTSWPATSRS